MTSIFPQILRRFVGLETANEKLCRTGVAIFRGFFEKNVAQRIERRFEANLRRLGNLFPDYEKNANYNVFSLALAFCDPADTTLQARMAALTSPVDENLTLQEKEKFYNEIGDRLLSRFAFLAPRGIQIHKASFSRFELARPNSPYDFHALHQDAVPALQLDPTSWTAWVALSECGVDAPSLQYIDRKFSELLPEHQGKLFIPPAELSNHRFLRPKLNPGDLVIFTAYTLHGTWITREMTKARYSLDVRLTPK